ncbi:hypothetical protein ACFX2I_007183 [Malus domestica]
MASPSSESTSPIYPLPTESSNPNSSNSTSITIQNIRSMVPIKLTTTNYLTWSTLFALIFHLYNLTGHIDGSMTAPPHFLLDSSGNRTLNPAYVSWYENDQNILIWLNSTLSESLILYIVGVNSAHNLWQIEAIADALASVGSSIEDSDLISVTLHGLPPEYDSFVDVIQFCLGSTTIDELHGLLLSKEIQLANCKKSISEASSFQAFNTSTGIFPFPASNPNSQAFVAQSPSTCSIQSRGMDRPHNRGHFNRGNYKSFNNQRFFNSRGNS